MEVDKKLQEFILTYLVSFISHGQTKISTDALLDKINTTFNVDMTYDDIKNTLDSLVIINNHNMKSIIFNDMTELTGNSDTEDIETPADDEIDKLANAGAEEAMEKI